MAKLPWYMKPLKTDDKDHITIRLRRMWVWGMWFYYKLFKRKFNRNLLDYNG